MLEQPALALEAAAIGVPEPCPGPHSGGQTPNDQVPSEETISVVNLDNWLDVATIQPLRHDVVDLDTPRIQSSDLVFSAWNGGGDRLVMRMTYTPESSVPFESHVSQLYFRGADGVDWSARSGSIRIVELGDGELEVRILDVVLEKWRGAIAEPVVTRMLSEGSIVGPVRRSCMDPSSGTADPTWSTRYCGQIRQAAGF